MFYRVGNKELVLLIKDSIIGDDDNSSELHWLKLHFTYSHLRWNTQGETITIQFQFSTLHVLVAIWVRRETGGEVEHTVSQTRLHRKITNVSKCTLPLMMWRCDTQDRGLLLYSSGEEVSDIFETLRDQGEEKDYAKVVTVLNGYFQPKVN